MVVLSTLKFYSHLYSLSELDLPDNLLELLHQYLLFHLVLVLWRELLSLNLMNQPLLALNSSSAASSPLSAFMQLRRVSIGLWIGLWLKGMLWLVGSSVQITTTFCISAIKLFCFYHCVFTGAALLISFKNFTTVWLIVQHQRPSFWSLNIPSLLSIIISSRFLFKARDL